MTFHDSLVHLGIEEFEDRIFCSNSRGELFHLPDYFYMAQRCAGNPDFRPAFLAAVEFAEKNWTRPESVFQHMPRMLYAFLSEVTSPTE